MDMEFIFGFSLNSTEWMEAQVMEITYILTQTDLGLTQ